jgi:hypothetical protein
LSPTLREEHRLRVFDNRVLRRMYALETYIINLEGQKNLQNTLSRKSVFL